MHAPQNNEYIGAPQRRRRQDSLGDARMQHVMGAHALVPDGGAFWTDTLMVNIAP
jgi:hypothetical protein